MIPDSLQNSEHKKNHKKGWKDDREGRDRRAGRTGLRPPDIGCHIDHDRPRCALADRDHIREHLIIQPAVMKNHITDQRNRAVRTAEGKTPDLQKANE